MKTSLLPTAAFGLATLLLAACARGESAPAVSYPPHALRKLEGVTRPGLPPVTGHIQVDQFGYPPDAAKVAVLVNPRQGYNAADAYQPSPELQVRSATTGRIVLRGPALAWLDGEVHADSGDQGWWFDFGALSAPGSYYVFDAGAGLRSPVFRIADDVYRPVLIAAVRTYFYQRLGMPLRPPFAEHPWIFDAEMTQDSRARSVHAKDDPATERDLGGGWMDAGDTNKYPTFNTEVIHPLLHAYRANPAAFTDDFNIPESGNGLPDLLDELKWQLDWLLRMQDRDGGVFLKLGQIQYHDLWPPAKNTHPRYYLPKCSAAAIALAGQLAHAARVYGQFPAWADYAAELRARALLAWEWYEANPKTTDLDTGEVKAGIVNRSLEDQERAEAPAAFHLWRLTGEERFHERFRLRAPQTRQLSEWVWSVYETGSNEALVEYLDTPVADPALAARIRSQLRGSAQNPLWAPAPEADLYRAWMAPYAYHWGSHQVRAAYGHAALGALAALPDLAPADQSRLRARALDLLHSFHGVNPLSVVYLTNMGPLGAEHSVTRLYHERFGFHSPFAGNPPPGYLVGGPNRNYSGKGPPEAPDETAWITKQPPAKAYADFNSPWPLNSWEITENANYSQANYIRLLSAFVTSPPSGAPIKR